MTVIGQQVQRLVMKWITRVQNPDTDRSVLFTPPGPKQLWISLSTTHLVPKLIPIIKQNECDDIHLFQSTAKT
jgi:hypothetical protein